MVASIVKRREYMRLKCLSLLAVFHGQNLLETYGQVNRSCLWIGTCCISVSTSTIYIFNF